MLKHLYLCGWLATLVTSQAQLQFETPISLGSLNTSKVTEASGLAVSSANPGVFWTHNDGGNDRVYAFRMDGVLLAEWDMEKNPSDLEDLAVGPGPIAGGSYLYIGDIGSNAAVRDTVKIYRAPEPTIDPAWADAPVSKNLKDIETCDLKYPDGAFDAETLMIDWPSQSLYLATKQTSGTRIYRLALADFEAGQERTLEFVGEISFGSISGGAISRDGSTLILRREDFALGWTRASEETWATALTREGQVVPVVGPPDEPNGEGISFLPDGSGYVTISEGTNPPVNFFRRLAPTLCAGAPRFLAAPRFEDNSVRLEFTACPDTTLVIQAATILGQWQEIARTPIGATPATFLDTTSISSATRFYRLLVAP